MPEHILMSNCLIFLWKSLLQHSHLPLCLFHYWSFRNPDFEGKLPEDQLDALTSNVSSQSQPKSTYLLMWIKICKKNQRINNPYKDSRFSIFMTYFLKIKMSEYLNTQEKNIHLILKNIKALNFRFCFACLNKLLVLNEHF